MTGVQTCALPISTNTLQLNNRLAGYVNKHTTYAPQTGAAWLTLVTNKAKLPASGGVLTTATTITGASGCMACLNTAGVWCSATYSYLSSAATFQQDSLLATHNSGIYPGTVALSVTGAAFDSGSCCETDANFNTFVFTQTQRNTSVAHTDHDNTTS